MSRITDQCNQNQPIIQEQFVASKPSRNQAEGNGDSGQGKVKSECDLNRAADMIVRVLKVTRDPCGVVGHLVCGHHLDRQPDKASDLEYTKVKPK